MNTNIRVQMHKEMHKAKRKGEWDKILDFSKLDSVKHPKQPNLDILEIVLYAMGKKESEIEELE